MMEDYFPDYHFKKDKYIKSCEEQIASISSQLVVLRQNLENYQKVKKQLEENIKKLEIPTLAPICGVAYFCDAHYIKTNEVFIDLGDYVLAECSAYTAHKVLDRRIQEHQESIKNGETQIKNIAESVKFTKEFYADDDTVEICEEYDEKKEEEFKNNRRQMAKNRRKSDVQRDFTHEKAMKRLEELEKEEEEEKDVDEENISVGELANRLKKIDVQEKEKVEKEESDIDDDALEVDGDADAKMRNIEKMLRMPGVNKYAMDKLLQYLDNQSEEEDEEYEDEECEEVDSDDYEEVQPPAPEAIKSPPKVKKPRVRFSSKLEDVKQFSITDQVTINPDNEVVEKPATASILKHTEPTPVDRAALEPEHKEVVKMSTCTFPGEIIEKNLENHLECEPSTSGSNGPVITESAPKKVSRFRAARLK